VTYDGQKKNLRDKIRRQKRIYFIFVLYDTFLFLNMFAQKNHHLVFSRFSLLASALLFLS